MKSAYWGYWLVLLGVFIVVIMLLVDNLTTGNTQSYSLIKGITESAMLDSVDYAYYRTYGEVKINKEKFMEVFIRRMSETGNASTNYTIAFHEIYESPPKVSVKVSSKSSTFNVVGDEASFDIVDKIDAVLEGKELDPTYKYTVIDNG